MLSLTQTIKIILGKLGDYNNNNSKRRRIFLQTNSDILRTRARQFLLEVMVINYQRNFKRVNSTYLNQRKPTNNAPYRTMSLH